MSQALLAMMGAGTNAVPTYADDVFQAYTRTGTGADATVTTNIDMTQGYMLWSKGRSGATDHAIYDSARGVTYDLVSNSTAAQTTQSTGLKSVSSTGHTVGSLAKMNTNAATYVDWVFRKAARFFDVVTFTTDSSGNATFSHSLGATPGMVIVKSTASAGWWFTYHKDLTSTSYYLGLQSTSAQTNNGAAWISTSASSVSIVGSGALLNNSTAYVAYLFAHDTGADGLIQCGSFTPDGSGNATVNLGWEPQYVMMKVSSTTSDWYVTDAARGFPATANSASSLKANSSVSEGTSANFQPNATGFSMSGLGASVTIIYMAIRRPNKPPTVGTQVYNAIARTGTGAAATVTGVGFAPDLVIVPESRNTAGWDNGILDRLRGGYQNLKMNQTSTEAQYTNIINSFDMDGVHLGTDASIGVINYSGHTYINYFFKRAPGVFDIVCYTGTGSAHTESHNLGVAPELMIVKSRSNAYHWQVYAAAIGNTKNLSLNNVDNTGGPSTTFWNDTSPTSSVFSLGTAANMNVASGTFVAYLFATKSGVSKCGTYTGNGTTNAINCGFTTGARFVMIKRTDSTGDWYVWDTVRGIVAGNDPYLLINSTAAEVTSTDYIDPSTAGFELSSTAPAAINANGGTFVFLAFA